MAQLVTLDKWLEELPLPTKWVEESAWVQRLGEAIRRDNARGPNADVVGEVLQWQRADSYAEYIVVQADPLQIAHLPTGDRWEVETPLIRGLLLEDVQDMVDYDRKLKKLFAGRTSVRADEFFAAMEK